MFSVRDDSFYTTVEAARILGITVGQLHKQRHFLHTITTPDMYDRSYINGLAAILHVGKAHGHPIYDIPTIELYWLKHQHAQSSVTIMNKIYARCKQLTAGGIVASTADVCTSFHGRFTYDQVFDWARHEKIMAIRVGRKSFVSSRYLARLHTLFSLPTIQEAADRLGTSRRVIEQRRQLSKYASYKTPDGLYRIDLNSPPRRRPALLSISEAAKQLDMSPNTLRTAVREGFVLAVKRPKGLYIKQAVVDNWRELFGELDSEFTWLHESISHWPAGKALAFWEAAARMKKPLTTLHSWKRSKLLPCYDRSFSQDSKTRPHDLIPEAYIEALLTFTKHHSYELNSRTLRQYKRLCQSKGSLV